MAERPLRLIEPGVAMYDPASGEREERRMGPEEVAEYFGLGPDKVIEIQALAGDSTDNVPGAPGIGIKTAAQLLSEFGDLETLLARAGEIKQPKRREALTSPENVERIRLSKQLVTLVRDMIRQWPVPRLDPVITATLPCSEDMRTSFWDLQGNPSPARQRAAGTTRSSPTLRTIYLGGIR